MYFFKTMFQSCFDFLQAQAVTLTVAQAFKVALDLWEIAQESKFALKLKKENKKYRSLLREWVISKC